MQPHPVSAVGPVPPAIQQYKKKKRSKKVRTYNVKQLGNKALHIKTLKDKTRFTKITDRNLKKNNMHNLPIGLKFLRYVIHIRDKISCFNSSKSVR